jgi:SAM-dependent methyltransferase
LQIEWNSGKERMEMKTGNPNNRFKLSVRKSDKVLEIGGGHNPHPLSDVVVDKYVDNNYHRSGNILLRKNQKFMQADGENLPFEDNEFDYVICNQVLEHVENPAKFLDEQSRVAKRGFIETPSLIGEYLFPKESHKWVLLELENKLVLFEKKKIGMNSKINFGELFLHYLPKHSIGYKILERTYPDLMTVRYEWKDSIEYVVNPTDPSLMKYFENPWENTLINGYFQQRSLASETLASLRAVSEIVRSFFSNIVNKKSSYFRTERG